MILPESYYNTFPNLSQDAVVVGPPDIHYNCIAYSINCTKLFIQPIEKRFQPVKHNLDGTIDFWPTELECSWELSNILKFYRMFKYELHENDNYTMKFRKIALFCNPNTNDVTHAALQIGPNIWRSKLGPATLLQHQLYDIEGEIYGEVRCFVRRPRTIPKEYDFEVLERYLK